MSKIETRHEERDSLFLLAQLRPDGSDRSVQVRVRNLSGGGMMAEGDAQVTRGSRVEVELRAIGWVEGTVAWKQDNRFGIAFVDEIDARRVLAGSSDSFEAPRHIKSSTKPTDRLRQI
jgi:hypothetical protein